MAAKKIKINRAPVLTLWAAVVAERLGHDRDAALTLGKAVAGLNAQSKGRRLGIFKPDDGKRAEAKPRPRQAGREVEIIVLGRPVTAIKTPEGLRAAIGGVPIDPGSVRRYLEQKFGEDLGAARSAMEALAKAFGPEELARRAYGLYEAFRPSVPAGEKGWGAKGELDLGRLRSPGH